jgi:hypothetical protein
MLRRRRAPLLLAAAAAGAALAATSPSGENGRSVASALHQGIARSSRSVYTVRPPVSVAITPEFRMLLLLDFLAVGCRRLVLWWQITSIRWGVWMLDRRITVLSSPRYGFCPACDGVLVCRANYMYLLAGWRHLFYHHIMNLWLYRWSAVLKSIAKGLETLTGPLEVVW